MKRRAIILGSAGIIMAAAFAVWSFAYARIDPSAFALTVIGQDDGDPGSVRIKISNEFDFPIHYQIYADSDGTNRLDHFQAGELTPRSWRITSFSAPRTNSQFQMDVSREPDSVFSRALWRLSQFQLFTRMPAVQRWLATRPADWYLEGPKMFGVTPVVTVQR